MRKNYDTFSPAGKPSEQASKTASADGVLDDGAPLTSADVGSSSPRKRSGVGSASVEKRFDGDVEKRSDSGVIVDCNSVEESGAGADSFEVTMRRIGRPARYASCVLLLVLCLIARVLLFIFARSLARVLLFIFACSLVTLVLFH